MPDTSDCIFCNPDPNSLVYSGEDGTIVVDHPFAEGHVLVATKRHLPDLHDLEPDDAASMMRLAARVSRKLVSEYRAMKTYAAAIGDKDRHFHIHLLPKSVDSESLGPYIFGDKGWAHGAEIEIENESITRLRNLLNANNDGSRG
jgi:diadenosine tetraphosphate (Ap4A) HIT family hydrolase